MRLSWLTSGTIPSIPTPCVMQRLLNQRRDALGKDRVYLTRFGKPLDEAIVQEQDGLDFGSGPGEQCDEGYCWT